MLKAEAINRLGQRAEVATEAVERIRATKKALNAALTVLGERDDSTSGELVPIGKEFVETLDSLVAMFVSPPGGGFGGDAPPVSSQLSRVYGSLQTSWDAPTEAQRLRLEWAEAQLENALAEFNSMVSGDLAVYPQRSLAEAGIGRDTGGGGHSGYGLDWGEESNRRTGKRGTGNGESRPFPVFLLPHPSPSVRS